MWRFRRWWRATGEPKQAVSQELAETKPAWCSRKRNEKELTSTRRRLSYEEIKSTSERAPQSEYATREHSKVQHSIDEFPRKLSRLAPEAKRREVAERKASKTQRDWGKAVTYDYSKDELGFKLELEFHGCEQPSFPPRPNNRREWFHDECVDASIEAVWCELDEEYCTSTKRWVLE